MRILLDYKCTLCETVKEHFVENRPESVDCHLCSGPSIKIVSPVVAVLNVVSGDFPKSTRRWLKHRTDEMKRERQEA